MIANVDLPPVFTVADAMILCGLNEADAARVAAEVFNDDFTTTMDKSFKDLDKDIQSYSSLTVAEGRIRVNPGIKQKLRAFIQWSRDRIRMGMDPSTDAFPVHTSADLIKRYNTHSLWQDRSKTISDSAKPSAFTNDMKWEEWSHTFSNYLRTIAGRNGVPLSYVIRDSDTVDPTPNPSFLDNYVAMAPLSGAAYTEDAGVVHTLLASFISGNETAEAKVQGLMDKADGRLDFKALKTHYEGVGLHAKNIIWAEKVISERYYNGERKPQMWWDKFEQELTLAYTIFDKVEKREVHSDQTKLRTLLRKVQADFLEATKASIDVRATDHNNPITFQQALTIFRNKVNETPASILNKGAARRNINEVQRGGKVQSKEPIRWKPRRLHQDNKKITLSDGRVCDYHPAYKFPYWLFQLMTPVQKKTLAEQRAAYKNKDKKAKHSDKASVAESLRSIKEMVSNLRPPAEVQTSDHASVSEMGSIMTGRNQQAERRGNN